MPCGRPLKAYEYDNRRSPLARSSGKRSGRFSKPAGLSRRGCWLSGFMAVSISIRPSIHWTWRLIPMPRQPALELITPAPPMFTTRRSRYNRYANRYVLILEAAFIGFIFFYTVVTDIGKVMNLEFPDLRRPVIAIQNHPCLVRFDWVVVFLSGIQRDRHMDPRPASPGGAYI